MFFATYKNTVKTLFRSWAFWLAWGVVALIAFVNQPIVTFVEGYKPDSLSMALYNQQVNNYIYASFLVYALPIFTVITTVLVLNHDYGDQFFEIEKAAGVRLSRYFFGRLTAIVTVQLVFLFLASGALLHLYVASWGGVEGFSLGAYLADSTFRLLSIILGGALPCVLFYVGLTYLVGTLSRGGVAAAATGFGTIILFVVLQVFKMILTRVQNSKAAAFYFDYFCHAPDKLKYFLFFWNVEGGWEQMTRWPYATSLGKAALSFAILAGSFVIFAAISYWRIYKREV